MVHKFEGKREAFKLRALKRENVDDDNDNNKKKK